MTIDVDVEALQGALGDVVAADTAAVAALAASIAAAERYYDARVNTLDVTDTPARMNAERIAHTCAVADLAAALRTTAGVIEHRLGLWWGSRPHYREMFTAGEISIEALRTIHDHTLGATAATLVAVERDIASAARTLTPVRLGHEIDRLLCEIDPDWQTRARKRAACTKKRVRVTRLPQGLARMSATIGARDVAEAEALIDAELTLVCGLDPRALDTRRSDAFMALVRGGHLSCLCGRANCLEPYSDDDDDDDETKVATDSPATGKVAADKAAVDGGAGDGGAGSDSVEKVSATTCAAEPGAAAGSNAAGSNAAGSNSADRSDSPGSENGGSSSISSSGSSSDGSSSDGSSSDGSSSDGAGDEADPPIPDAVRYPHGATTPPAKPLVVISADLETLLGLHNRAAYLHGYGPIDSDTLRTLAADATWQIIFTLSRKYLDTLTDYDDHDCTDHHYGEHQCRENQCGEHQYDDPPSPATFVHEPQCPCICGTHPRPPSHPDRPSHPAPRIAELIDAAHAHEHHQATELPTRLNPPTTAQRRDDAIRAELAHQRITDTETSDTTTDTDTPMDTDTDKTDTDKADETPTDTVGTKETDEVRDDADSSNSSDSSDSAEKPDDRPPTSYLVSAASDIVLGRSRVLPAGIVPPPLPDPDAARRRSAGNLAEYWRAVITANPNISVAEYPDGHGGHHTPPPGALTYTPNAALAMWIRAHYPTCRHPGCNVPSSRCDLDHIVEYNQRNPAAGGWTIRSNLAPFCRTHHNLKTTDHWSTELLPGDVIHTTDSLGNHYFTAPDQ